MQSLTSAFDPAVFLLSRGIDLTALGGAYLALLAALTATIAGFLAARTYLVISPNRSAGDYSVYTSVVLATLLIATVLENELLPSGSIALQYVTTPQLLMLLGLHLWLWYRQEPWLIALAGAAIAASILVVVLTAVATEFVRAAHWVAVVALAALLAFLWRKSVSTKRGFVTAKSIYIGSKETLDTAVRLQKPWLGLSQWMALIGASVLLAIGNALLRGSEIAQIPALDVALESALLIVTTAFVCAVPAVSYWLARRAWMPELTRFVWLVWIVVSFAFTYGNFLNHFSET
jgi:hypothetical protein